MGTAERMGNVQGEKKMQTQPQANKRMAKQCMRTRRVNFWRASMAITSCFLVWKSCGQVCVLWVHNWVWQRRGREGGASSLLISGLGLCFFCLLLVVQLNAAKANVMPLVQLATVLAGLDVGLVLEVLCGHAHSLLAVGRSSLWNGHEHNGCLQLGEGVGAAAWGLQ